MAVGLTATLEPERLAVRLNVTGIVAAADTLTITRTAPSGNEAGVRGAVDAPCAGITSFLTRDFEAPLNLALTYRVKVFDGATQIGTATVSFTLAYTECQPWLIDLAKPTNSLTVEVESMRELEFDAATGVHRILNRRAPILTSLPAWTPNSELIVLTETETQRDQVRNLLGSGYPFLLRTIPEQGIGNMYLGPTQFVEERILTLGTMPQRRFRVACVQVERPDPGIYVPQAPNTYANVKATYATYAALKAGVASYDALAYVYGPEGSPIVPWLPDDV